MLALQLTRELKYRFLFRIIFVLEQAVAIDAVYVGVVAFILLVISAGVGGAEGIRARLALERAGYQWSVSSMCSSTVHPSRKRGELV